MAFTPYRLVVIGGSAGSFQTVVKLLSTLPRDYPIPIALCLHRMRSIRNGFADALSIKSNKPVIEPYDKQILDNDHFFLAPANYHLSIESCGVLSLSTEELNHNSRPAIDLLFESAAYSFGRNLVAVLLSGANKDGAKGISVVKKMGGLCVVQNPEESLIGTMPSAALHLSEVDCVLTSDEIVQFLLELGKHK